MAMPPGPASCTARAVRPTGTQRTRVAAAGRHARARVPSPSLSLVSRLSCRRWPGSRAPCVLTYYYYYYYSPTVGVR